jgi:serine/threonine-protein kinase
MNDDPATAPTISGEAHLDELAGGEDELTASGISVLGARFEILGIVGAGGMGTVYRARDRELDEVVALKIMKGVRVSAEALERFLREVKLARRVTHKNVARVYELGVHQARRFFTMELIDGPDRPGDPRRSSRRSSTAGDRPRRPDRRRPVPTCALAVSRVLERALRGG